MEEKIDLVLELYRKQNPVAERLVLGKELPVLDFHHELESQYNQLLSELFAERANLTNDQIMQLSEIHDCAWVFDELKRRHV